MSYSEWRERRSAALASFGYVYAETWPAVRFADRSMMDFVSGAVCCQRPLDLQACSRFSASRGGTSTGLWLSVGHVCSHLTLHFAGHLARTIICCRGTQLGRGSVPLHSRGGCPNRAVASCVARCAPVGTGSGWEIGSFCMESACLERH